MLSRWMITIVNVSYHYCYHHDHLQQQQKKTRLEASLRTMVIIRFHKMRFRIQQQGSHNDFLNNQ